MGGYGSGARAARYALVEDSRVVSLAMLRRWGILGRVSSPWLRYSWSRGGEPWGDIQVRVNWHSADGALELWYSSRQAPSTEWTPVRERFPLTTTTPTYGGARFWVHCRCGRRVANLYNSPRSPFYRCRRCARVVYSSQRENRPDRLLRRARRLRARLVAGELRPGGMHESTYLRLVEKAEALEDAATGAFLASLRLRERAAR